MLKAKTIVTGCRLGIHYLEGDRRCTAYEAVRKIVEKDPDKAQDLYELLVHMAKYPVPSNLLRKLAGSGGVWEIRKFKNFRIYGFKTDDANLYLCCHEYKTKKRANRRILRRVVDLKREWLERIGQ